MTARIARRARSLPDAARTTRARWSKRGDRTHLTTARYAFGHATPRVIAGAGVLL